jgi:lipopolysaccharide export system permease protein
MPILARYLLVRLFKIFAICMLATAGLFVFIDFFGRIDGFLQFAPRAADVASYFALKIPGVVSEMFPMALLLATLINVGLLTRQREILAMRACGVSTWQLAKPMLVLAGIACALMVAWNETIVPAATAQQRFINDVVIKKKPSLGRYNATSVWLQDPSGFLNIDYFDANNQAIYGLTLYESDPSFKLNRIIEIPALRWRNDRWDIIEGSVKNFGPDGEIVTRPLEPGQFVLPVAPAELTTRRRYANEFSFVELWRRINLLRARGLSTLAVEVDLHEKMARPFAGLVMVLIALPLAARSGRRAGMTASLGMGLAVAFLYFFVSGVSASAGRSGTIPPMLSAWTANILFTIVALAFYAGSDLRRSH